jgi:tRNA-splicing ligase RtcB (3'-phosphate/5'-hydroxy nucleic acid ligase)
MELVKDGPYRFRIPQHGQMRVPGVVYASGELIPDLAADRSLEQVANVAALPGIVAASYAMPDLHLGYGFPIGGVAATNPAAGGVVSPGGVGFDISCGVRLLTASLEREEVMPVLGTLMDQLAAAVPRGAGRGGIWHLAGPAQMRHVLAGGARYALEQGYGVEGDVLRCEDGGAVADADPGQVSARAIDRGLRQVGSLGSGNHFLEVQAVEEVYDAATARRFGLSSGQVCVMIHCGSRGLGHQICGDHVRIMDTAMPRYGITVPDRQLACAPVSSPKAAATWVRWPLPPTTDGPTGTCSPIRPARFSPVWLARGLTWYTTYPTTWRRWKPTRWTGSRCCCACTARAPPARFRPVIRTCQRTCAPLASRC